MKVYIVFEIDGLQKDFQRSSFANQVQELKILNQKLENGNRIWQSWAEAIDGNIILLGLGRGKLEIPSLHLEELDKKQLEYNKCIDELTTSSIGVGLELSEAEKAMCAAQARGGDKILFYTNEIDKELEESSSDISKSEDDLLECEVLSKEDNAAAFAHVAGGGIQGHHRGLTHQKPIEAAPSASEHSQGEALASLISDTDPGELERTHAASAAEDLEGAFHHAAGITTQRSAHEQQQKVQTHNELKQKIVQILQTVKQSAPELEQIKDQEPEIYNAVMQSVQAMIQMAKELLQDKGGPGQFVEDQKFNPEDLALGTKQEMQEHGLPEERAKEIAKDHLIEDPNYYKANLGKTDERMAPVVPPGPKKLDGLPPHAATHEHIKHPSGTAVEDKAQVYVDHRNPTTGQKEGKGHVRVEAGQTLSLDGHPISTRNMNGK